ncbi:MFS general substrate transporter [Saitoella complicata NRRL Y-17804]|uniref:Major facilitator superfamily (MFS) profile domain-containing protein n=1 Tax=Saitoella complicata (strain BCRC 22490 / CBS 7301 / JCM 7358 / NBRC 10748 / NRRL Y-17804) TaxID=698492 RepID=A0A0E9NRC7_SAICN|nr:MFS general substrate transporter [Saitoella complicata NRRL Y-17804]ODQ49816.1 MFS general substrate transporter [Saitoella complicata NRRL Y-17804]GAO52407.1 hypothetical protein G7K_6485-t1 [Saitoella complicata NRRL Y-17804]
MGVPPEDGRDEEPRPGQAQGQHDERQDEDEDEARPRFTDPFHHSQPLPPELELPAPAPAPTSPIRVDFVPPPLQRDRHQSTLSFISRTEEQEPPHPRPFRFLRRKSVKMLHSLGVLHDQKIEDQLDVPGTVQLYAPTGESSTAPSLSSSSHNDPALQTNNAGIILRPQPSSDPRDPLNWPLRHRDLAFTFLIIHSLVGGGQTPILAAAFPQVSQDLGVSLSKVSITTGSYMLALGIGSVFASPLSLRWGKRGVWILGILIMFVSTLWAGFSHSYGSLVAARVVEGFGVSPCECLASPIIADLYFQHQRGFRVGLYTLFLIGGKNLVPLVAAAVLEGTGSWRWIFWIVAMICVGSFVGAFLFLPETSWVRDYSGSSCDSSAVEEKKEGDVGADAVEGGDGVQSTGSSPTKVGGARPHVEDGGTVTLNLPIVQKSVSPPAPSAHATQNESNPPSSTYTTEKDKDPESGAMKPHTLFSDLRVYRGRLTQTALPTLFARPFVLYTYPTILWSALLYSLSVVWLIVMSEVLSQVFRAEPYNFTPMGVGLTYISALIGSMAGSGIAGKMSDWTVRWMTKKNGGVMEPEFRLVLAAPVALTTTIGLWGFGWSASRGDPWIVPTVLFGILAFGCTLGSTVAITYTVDSHREIAGEAMVTINLSKNLVGFVISLVVNEWVDGMGLKGVFFVLGGIQLAVSALTVPLYVAGKRTRGRIHRRKALKV